MTRFSAHGLLLLAALFWGCGNVVQKTALEHLGPLGATGARCAIAALVLWPLLLRERRAKKKAGFLISALGVGLVFSAGIGLQQAAYQWTTVTNASFLVNVCTILTPFIAWLLAGRPPGRVAWSAAAVTVLGAYFMSGASLLTALGWGDLLCLQSAAAFALWYVLLEGHMARHGRPIATALVQFALTAALFLPASAYVEGAPPAVTASGIWNVVALGLISTAIPYALLTVAQAHVSSTAAAVIVSAEGLFGAAAAFAILGERPGAEVLFGAALISTAILAVAFEPVAALRSRPRRILF